MLRAFYIPTRYSSTQTRGAAEIAASELGIPFVILSIEEAFERSGSDTQDAPAWGSATTLTVQNIKRDCVQSECGTGPTPCQDCFYRLAT